jgi:hypothetical protein
MESMAPDMDTTKWRTDPHILPELKTCFVQPGAQRVLLLRRGEKNYEVSASLTEVPFD